MYFLDEDLPPEDNTPVYDRVESIAPTNTTNICNFKQNKCF